MNILVTICVIIGFIATGACLIGITHRVETLAKITEQVAVINKNVADDLIATKKKTEKDLDELAKLNEQECRVHTDAQTQIDAIFDRLDRITEDIKRIDADEKEIRRYYCNFREPAAGGVDWAKDYPAEDKDDGFADRVLAFVNAEEEGKNNE